MKELIVNEHVRITDPSHTDLHMHTVFCDGKNTPEEMVLSAIGKGMTCIGFSGHSYVSFDPAAGMDEEGEQGYLQEIGRLKKVYAGQIRIFCGTELDYHTLPDPDTDAGRHRCVLRRYKETYDYLIGSVHYIPARGGEDSSFAGYAAVDDTPEIFLETVRTGYHGDPYEAAEAYFQLAADVVRRTGCDIIGHLDLISKFNQRYHIFDEKHPRYIRAWKRALDRLIPEGKIFEINTGAMSRGWRDVPYPAPQMQAYILQRGGRMLLASDSHTAQTIGHGQKTDCKCSKDMLT